MMIAVMEGSAFAQSSEVLLSDRLFYNFLSHGFIFMQKYKISVNYRA